MLDFKTSSYNKKELEKKSNQNYFQNLSKKSKLTYQEKSKFQKKFEDYKYYEDEIIGDDVSDFYKIEEELAKPEFEAQLESDVELNDIRASDHEGKGGGGAAVPKTLLVEDMGSSTTAGPEATKGADQNKGFDISRISLVNDGESNRDEESINDALKIPEL